MAELIESQDPTDKEFAIAMLYVRVAEGVGSVKKVAKEIVLDPYAKV